MNDIAGSLVALAIAKPAVQIRYKFIHERMDFNKYVINCGTEVVPFRYIIGIGSEDIEVLAAHGFTYDPYSQVLSRSGVNVKPNDKVIIGKFIEKLFVTGDGFITYKTDMIKIWNDYFLQKDLSNQHIYAYISRIMTEALKERGYGMKNIVRNPALNQFRGLMPKYGSLERFLKTLSVDVGTSGENHYEMYEEWCDEHEYIPYPLKVVNKKLGLLTCVDEVAMCVKCKTRRRVINRVKVSSRSGVPLVIGNCEKCHAEMKILAE